jgi:pimeloyl-ACP methyl ester carboxylesterase
VVALPTQKIKIGDHPAAPLIAGAEEKWLTLEGHRMRYLRSGVGPPLLLIPGLLAYSFSWRFNIEALSKARTVYAPDLLGTGLSDRPAAIDCSMTGIAHRLLAFQDQIGVSSFDLLGTSHGGGVAVRMSAMAPERVGKLMLSAPVNPWSGHGTILTRLLATQFGGACFRRAVPLIAAGSYVWLDRMYGDRRRIKPGTVEGYKGPMLAPGGWDYALGIMRCWRADLEQLAHDYELLREKAALILWGSKDRAVVPSSANEIVKRMAKAKVVVFKGVGHLPYEEVPEEFNAAVGGYLESCIY